MRGWAYFFLVALSIPAFAGELVDCGKTRQSNDTEAYERIYNNFNAIMAGAYQPWNRPEPQASPSPDPSNPSDAICRDEDVFMAFRKNYCDQMSIPIGHFSGRRWRLEYGLGVDTNFGNFGFDTPVTIFNNWTDERAVYFHFKYQF